MRRRTAASRVLPALVLALLIWLPPAMTLAQAVSDFEPIDYLVEVDGKPAAAEVFQSRRAGAFLIISSELASPVLLRLREAAVESVNLLKIDRRADGGLTLLPDPVLDVHGSFRVSAEGTGVSFAVGERTVELMQKPPLLGLHGLDGMREYSSDYVRAAQAYSPSAPILTRLRSESRQIKVEIYFGSWCPFCQETVPRMMRVAEELDGSQIQFVFYGLPRDMSSDRKAKEMDIHGVPTGIIFAGGREIGRIVGNSWKVPELALNNILVSRS